MLAMVVSPCSSKESVVFFDPTLRSIMPANIKKTDINLDIMSIFIKNTTKIVIINNSVYRIGDSVPSFDVISEITDNCIIGANTQKQLCLYEQSYIKRDK